MVYVNKSSNDKSTQNFERVKVAKIPNPRGAKDIAVATAPVLLYGLNSYGLFISTLRVVTLREQLRTVYFYSTSHFVSWSKSKAAVVPLFVRKAGSSWCPVFRLLQVFLSKILQSSPSLNTINRRNKNYGSTRNRSAARSQRKFRGDPLLRLTAKQHRSMSPSYLYKRPVSYKFLWKYYPTDRLYMELEHQAIFESEHMLGAAGLWFPELTCKAGIDSHKLCSSNHNTAAVAIWTYFDRRRFTALVNLNVSRKYTVTWLLDLLCGPPFYIEFSFSGSINLLHN